MTTADRSTVDALLRSPPRAYSMMPFWFWNDELDVEEIRRQIADFEAHGVFGFVIHPRVGLPRSISFLSDAMLCFMRVAIEEAAQRDMKVILYDEGMYPSGAASGQVVTADPALACRGLAMLRPEAGAPAELPPDANVVAELPTRAGGRVTIIDRPVRSVIRGLHYIGDGPAEDAPPMSDILNPAAVAMFVRLVYDRFHAAFGEHFGGTILGIFTDEPNPLGRVKEKGVWPGTAGIVEHVSRLIGYDFRPHLPALWLDDEPDAARHRAAYRWAVRRRLEETWYAPLSDWCDRHGVSLCGHPADGDEIGAQRFFQIPGQDLVWRWVAPDEPSAIEGAESTQGKCSASAMIHLRRRRNSNEFCGAYGHETTFEELQWLAHWCLVRGVNLLIPHAFYYSVRGPRRDERPPQVGPHSPWWDRFHPFADACRRLCWLNSDAAHICDVAILTGSDHCPWQAARACFENQWDFNYLEDRLLLHDATVDHEGIRIADMRYRALIVEDESLLTPPLRRHLQPLMEADRVLRWPCDIAVELGRRCVRDVNLAKSSPGVRYRHVAKEGEGFYLFFNERREPVDTPLRIAAAGERWWVCVTSGDCTPAEEPLRLSLPGHAVALLRVSPSRLRG